MKKFSKYIFMACALCLGFTSCSDDDDYVPGVEDPGVYVYADQYDYKFLPDMTQMLTVKVGRTDVSGEATVHLGCDNDKFTVPATVTIPAGKKTTDVHVNFNMETGSSEELKIYVKDDHASAYGNDTISIAVLRDFTWEKLGATSITSEFFGGTAAAVMYKAKEAMVYRIIEPFYEFTGKKGSVLTFELTEDGQHLAKEISPVKTTYVHSKYGDVYVRNQDLKEYDITRDGNVITLPLEYIVSVGSFGWSNEQIEIPE